MRIERLTPRVRQVVDFLERCTGLQAQPPVTMDVTNITPTAAGMQRKIRLRQHGPIQVKSGRPLDED